MADIFALLQKKTDSVDISKQLLKYIKKYHGAHEVDTYKQVIEEIQRMRDEARNLQDQAESSKELLLKYFLYLQHISAHFPIHEGSKIKLNFTWYDSFTKKKCTQSNIYYEQACVLFNAAAIESQLAAVQKMNTNDGPKLAIQRLQSASSILKYIKQEISPKIVEKISSDISPESLDCLSQMMLAYAQQCVYSKAKKAGMKNVTLAKLTSQVSYMYKNVLQMMNVSGLNGQFDKNWQSFFRYHSLYFEALTDYYLSTDLHDNDEIGEEISRLEKCKGIIKSALGYAKNLPSSLQQEGNSLLSKISSALKIANDENQKIYHLRVPKYSSLPETERKLLVKEISFPDLDAMFNIQDPFSSLVPVSVLEHKNNFNKQLDELSQSSFHNSRKHKEQIKNTLSQMGLPGAILAAEQEEGFPDTIYQKVERIQNTGGVNRLEDLRTTLGGLASETFTMIQDMEKSLENEEKEDKECRQQFASRWKRLPSGQLTVNLKKQLTDYKSKAEVASKSDGIIQNKIGTNEKKLSLLSLSKSELDDRLPKLEVGTDDSELGRSHSQLKESLGQMESFYQREEEIEKEFDSMRETIDIDNILILNQSQLEQTVEDQLLPFKEKLEELNQLSVQEDELLEEIQRLNTAFIQSKSSGSALNAREDFIQEVVSAVNIYDEILSNIKEGIQFYSSMQDIVEKLGSKIESFILARKTEKSDLISDIQREMAQLGVTPQQQQSVPQQSVPPPQQQQRPPPNYQGGGQTSIHQYNLQYQYPPQHQQAPQHPQYSYPPQYNNPQQYPPQYSGYQHQQHQPYPGQQQQYPGQHQQYPGHGQQQGYAPPPPQNQYPGQQSYPGQRNYNNRKNQ